MDQRAGVRTLYAKIDRSVKEHNFSLFFNSFSLSKLDIAQFYKSQTSKWHQTKQLQVIFAKIKMSATGNNSCSLCSSLPHHRMMDLSDIGHVFFYCRIYLYIFTSQAPWHTKDIFHERMTIRCIGIFHDCPK